MKKLFFGLALALATTVAQAGTFHSFSFLNAMSVQVTNTIPITNLLSVVSTGTNVTGTVYTNLNGIRTSTSPGTNDSVNLFKVVPLADFANNGLIFPIYTNQAPGSTVMAGPYANACIYIRLVGASGANAAVTFQFVPVPSAFNPVTGLFPDFNQVGADDNVAGDLLSIAITATTTTEIRSRTAFDVTKFIGCAGIMLRVIINADTDATSAVQVLECTLNWWTP